MDTLRAISRCATAALIAAATACAGSTTTPAADTPNTYPDTLRVATLYSPMSYFYYREDTMGYDYNLIADFATAKQMTLQVEVVPGLERAIAMLDSGQVDIIACEVPITAEYRPKVYPCGPETLNSQVLVQRSDVPDSIKVHDVADLPGRHVWVERNSKYQYRLENLSQELGGGINIHTIDRDTLIGDDLIEMVSKGEIPLTVVNSDIARLNKTYFRNVDISVPISFSQRSAWGVAPHNRWLGDSITAWLNTTGTRRTNEQLLKRYFELSKNAPAELTPDLSKGTISPYDDLYRHYAAQIGWDWRLIAAQGFVESHFRSDLVSWAGARGIMQIMPSTARANNVNPDDLTDPETSIRLAVKILKALENLVGRYVTDPEQRRMFTIAAYNSGGAHIIDAIALARKYGRDPGIWNDNVADALLMKSDERYYTDPVVKYGYFRGRQTTEYVRHVYDFYHKTLKHIKL